MSRSGNSVLKYCVWKAERTFQVVNLFHEMSVGSYVDTGCVFAKFVDVVYNR